MQHKTIARKLNALFYNRHTFEIRGHVFKDDGKQFHVYKYDNDNALRFQGRLSKNKFHAYIKGGFA